MKVKRNGKWETLGGWGPEIIGDYVLLTPDMVSGDLGSSNQRYSGTATKLIIGNNLGTTNLQSLFSDYSGAELSLILLNSFVTNMSYMFQNSQALELDLSSFDTSKVTSMSNMFRDSQALELDLSSFDTSNVTNMSTMFRDSQALELDLSSFDTSKVTSMSWMFSGCSATVGYARTQADADRFNASSNKPTGLTFVVKP